MKYLKVIEFRLRRNRRGYLLFNTMILVLLLVFTGFAFMRWAVDEAYQNHYKLASKQAFYVAEFGACEQALKYIRSRPPNQFDPTTNFSNGVMRDKETNEILGHYYNVVMQHLGGADNNNIFHANYYYDVYASGTVPLVNGHGVGASKLNKEVARTIRMRVKLRTYGDYMYLTNNEQTVYNEIIWFWQHDVLYGRVHSNSQIGIKNTPQFFGPVSTTAEEFYESSANPYFEFQPLFNAPAVHFPQTAEAIRQGASAMSNFIEDEEGQLWTRLYCDDGVWVCWHWPAGTAFDSTETSAFPGQEINLGNNTGIFVDGDLFFWGTQINGRITIGTAGNMYLADDVVIQGHFPNSREQIESTNPNILGLISESQIIILDSYPNGRGNSGGSPDYDDQTHITITAALVALDESFTFQHQNDPWDTYRWCPGNPGPDERGDIILRGAVTQNRRGYVHRSNCGGTGYGKDYLYDYRIGRNPPPFYMEATDDQGNALFDIVRVEEVPPGKNPKVRYKPRQADDDN